MTRQLTELDKLKAEFVSVASHELKTPINVMIGYLQLLDEGVYGPLTEEQIEVHKTVASQADTLLRLVKRLLDVSRFEAGGGRLEPRAIKLAEISRTSSSSAFAVLARPTRDRRSRSSAAGAAGPRCTGTSTASTKCSATCCRTRSSSRRAAAPSSCRSRPRI